MGTRGPIPSREDSLARPRSRKGGDQQAVTKGVARPAEQPDADPEWHPIAAQLWHSLGESGQCDFYQQSDWAIAFSLCDDLSYYKRGVKRSGQMLQTIMSSLERLLVTEGDRRRVRIELDDPPREETSAAVLAIANYKAALEVDE